MFLKFMMIDDDDDDVFNSETVSLKIIVMVRKKTLSYLPLCTTSFVNLLLVAWIFFPSPVYIYINLAFQ
jgi:hypothetical protein